VGVERVNPIEKPGANPVHQPFGVKGRNIGAPAGGDDHGVICLSQPPMVLSKVDQMRKRVSCCDLRRLPLFMKDELSELNTFPGKATEIFFLGIKIDADQGDGFAAIPVFGSVVTGFDLL